MRFFRMLPVPHAIAVTDALYLVHGPARAEEFEVDKFTPIFARRVDLDNGRVVPLPGPRTIRYDEPGVHMPGIRTRIPQVDFGGTNPRGTLFVDGNHNLSCEFSCGKGILVGHRTSDSRPGRVFPHPVGVEGAGPSRSGAAIAASHLSLRSTSAFQALLPDGPDGCAQPPPRPSARRFTSHTAHVPPGLATVGDSFPHVPHTSQPERFGTICS